MSEAATPALRTRITLTKIDVSGESPRVVEEIVIENGVRGARRTEEATCRS